MKLNLKCSAPKISYDLEGNMTLSMEVDKESQRDAKEGYDELRDKQISCELKKYRPKRSLDANSYLWVLCSKLADKLRISKEEVYRQEIRDAGVCTVLPMNTEQLAEIEERMTGMGLGWFCEMLDIGIDGVHTVAVYYGSSTYNTLEMKRLLDNTVEDAKLQGIQTETPDEIALMMARWDDCCKRTKSV